MRQVTKMPCHLRDAFQSSWFSGRACNSLQRETGSRLTPKYLILPHCPSQPPAFFFFFVLSFLSLFFLSLKSNIGAKFLQKRTGRYGSINRQREFLKIRRRCLDSRDPQLSTCSMCWSPQSSFQSFLFLKRFNHLPSLISTLLHHDTEGGQQGVVERVLDYERKDLVSVPEEQWAVVSRRWLWSCHWFCC